MLLDRPLTVPHALSASGVAWEDTACLLCGRDDAEILTEAADPIPSAGPGLRFAIVQCRRCGLNYTNPRPSPGTISRFYPSEYGPHLPHRGRRSNRMPSRFWSWILGRPCPERRGLLPLDPPGRLLDFGCGSGSYLHRMARLGWTVTGVDLAPEVIRAIHQTPKIQALSGTLPHPDLRPCSFEVVTMWQSLEHVHRPLQILRAAYELLVPGGKLIVAVPNYASLPARWFAERWFGLDLPRHLTHFTPESLRTMLEIGGFQIDSLRSAAHADWLCSSAVQANRTGTAGGFTRLMTVRSAARLAEWGCYLLGRAESIVAVVTRPG